MFEALKSPTGYRSANLLGLSALCLTLAGCNSQSDSPKAESAIDDRLTPTAREETRKDRLQKVRDLGAGVFVFPRSAYFPETLSDFRTANPDYRIISVSQSADQTSGILDQTDSRANSMVVVVDWVPAKTNTQK